MRRYISGFQMALFFLSGLAWADSAPTLTRGIDASDVVPIKNHNIRMLKEVVHIDCAWTTYSVQADFWFLNFTDREQDVQIGFPIDCFTDWRIEEARNSVKILWNGKPVKFSYGKLQHDENRNGDLNRQWVYWDVRFAPYERPTNRVSFTYPTWNKDEGSKNDEPFAYLKYILKSGAAWEGPIDSILVQVNYGNRFSNYLGRYKGDDGESIPSPSNLTIYPKNYMHDKKSHTVTWEYKYKEPDMDIYFGWGDVPDFGALDKEHPIQFTDDPTSKTK